MTDYLKSPLFQFKVGELIISLICAGIFLARSHPTTSVLLTQVVDFTIFGFILLNTVIIVTVVLQEAGQWSRTMFMIISGVGAVLYLVTSVIILVEYFGSNGTARHLIAGLATLFNCFVYGFDTFYIVTYFEG
ncbi:uncharacterized protein LOC111062298 [Nilaparvata lugens]|uniref:uncharacterized protein LOC111062298 n=1 Tax=Nilaparvata lugens TaxID=108931 RepID=UPI000B98A036|nr:uncharacterized protein LOC111062298 [Nilaparvata lugens]XP_039298335.1 uncharacterized protein LOC111062298 [Nilaparvata lugens]